MTIREEVYLAALAGLLHDVGKFAQRAGEEPDEDYQAFTREDYGPHGAHASGARLLSAATCRRHGAKGWRRSCTITSPRIGSARWSRWPTGCRRPSGKDRVRAKNGNCCPSFVGWAILTRARPTGFGLSSRSR